MSNGGLDLGSAFSTVGFINDPVGADAFKRSAAEIIALQEQIANGPKAATGSTLASQFTAAGTAAQTTTTQVYALQQSLQGANTQVVTLANQLNKLAAGKLFGGQLLQVVELTNKLADLEATKARIDAKLAQTPFRAGELQQALRPNVKDGTLDVIGQHLTEDAPHLGPLLSNDVADLASKAQLAAEAMDRVNAAIKSTRGELGALASHKELTSAIGQAAIEGVKSLDAFTAATEAATKADDALNAALASNAPVAHVNALGDAYVKTGKEATDALQRVIDAQNHLQSVTQSRTAAQTRLPDADAAAAKELRQQEDLLEKTRRRLIVAHDLAGAEELIGAALDRQTAIADPTLAQQSRLQVLIRQYQEINTLIAKSKEGPVQPAEGVAQTRTLNPEVEAARAEQAARRLYESRLRLANQAEAQLPAAERTYAASLQLVADEELRAAGSETRLNKIRLDFGGVTNLAARAQRELAGQVSKVGPQEATAADQSKALRESQQLADLEAEKAAKAKDYLAALALVDAALQAGNNDQKRTLELEIQQLELQQKIAAEGAKVGPKEATGQQQAAAAAAAESAETKLYNRRLALANLTESNLPAAERTYANSLALVATEATRVAGNEEKLLKVQADREGVVKRLGVAQEQTNKGGFGSALGGFAGDLALGFGVANIGLSIGSTVKDTISQSAELARAAEVSSTAFHAQTEKYGIDSKTLLDALRAASHGTIADANLQATAVKSLSEGVGTSVGQLTSLMEIARVRGKEFGFDTATAYEKITQGIEGLLPRQLKQIGIIVNQKTADDEYAASIGKTVTQLSDEEKQQALLNEVLKSQQGILKDTAFAAEDEADRFAKAQAEKQQALTRLGHVTAPLITNAVSSIADILDAATGGTDVSSRDQATINNLIRQSSTIEEATGKANDYAAALFKSANGMDNLAAIRLGFDTAITPEVFRQVKAQQALDDAAAHTTEALAAQKDAAESLRQKFSDLSGITGFPTAPAPLVGAPSIAGLQRNQDAFDEQHKAAFEKNAADLEQAGITAADQLIAGEAKKNYDLEQLDADHAARIADINQRIKDDAQKTQDDISAAETEGRDARAALVQENQQAVADLVARHTLAEQRTTDSQNRQDQRTARDQRTADEKTERDFQTGQQKARDTLAQQLHDSDVKYGQDREKLIRNQNEAIEKETKRHNDELVQAAEAAHVSRLQGEASFEQQLDGIINHVGGGGIAARKKALADLKAAKAEADALVAQTGDTQAGAALLAEREKQIIGNREADTENAQRLRDARRGGALSTGLAKDEISVERDLQNQANAAAIQAIKDGAVDKKKHYDDSLNDQKKANDQALDDLKKSHDDATAKSKADLKQRQDDEDAAHKAQKAATDAARKQAALDLAADRKTEKDLRDADYAQQLKQLNDSNDDKVKKFDDAQTKRIAQIAKHGAEQQVALQKELDKEADQYDKHQTAILHSYDVLVQGIKDKIKDLEDHLSLVPEDARQAELVKDQQLLADKLGSAFADRYQQYLHHVLGTPLPSDSLGGNVGDNFTPGHDPLLSQSAINSILPGAHEGDTFSALRPGTTGIHQGLDISTGHAGDHILTPVDGQVIYAGAARKGEEWAGNNVQIQTGGSQGPIWYFGHIGKALVAAGDTVKRGQAVAEEGDSGVPGQVHVHLQLRPGPGEAPIDPTQLLNSLAGGTPSAGTARASGAIQRPKNTPSDLAAQAYSGGRLSALQSTAAGVVVGPTYNVSIPVNLAGSTFAPGTSLTEVQNVVTTSVNSAFLAFESQQNQQLHHLNTAFPG